MADEVEIWVSDENSFFAHLSRYSYPANATKCGINLGTYEWSIENLAASVRGKPKCSACRDGVRM